MSEPKRHDPIQGEILHVYDGIEEADNALPRWWLASFYLAIVFGVVYWFAYHEFEVAPTPSAAYVLEQANAEAQAPRAEEAELLALLEDPAAIAEGRSVFGSTCAACHGESGQGEIGPNLTDDHWLHGGAPIEIYGSIRDGIDASDARIEGSAGMPGWGPSLGESRVRAATAYLLSVRGTAVEGREPEGEVWEADADETEAEETDAEETNAEETDAEETDAEEGTDAEGTDAEETDAEETDAEGTDAEEPEPGAASDPADDGEPGAL